MMRDEPMTIGEALMVLTKFKDKIEPNVYRTIKGQIKHGEVRSGLKGIVKAINNER
ncbi:MAG: hypothetical protein SOZ40_05965 [Ezakiella sp.]|nr:hypothetical protein [Ezakiella sp.]